MYEFANNLINLIPILRDQPDWLVSILLKLTGFMLILWSVRRYFTNN